MTDRGAIAVTDGKRTVVIVAGPGVQLTLAPPPAAGKHTAGGTRGDHR